MQMVKTRVVETSIRRLKSVDSACLIQSTGCARLNAFRMHFSLSNCIGAWKYSEYGSIKMLFTASPSPGHGGRGGEGVQLLRPPKVSLCHTTGLIQFAE
jgi:hypothetical protein